MIKGGILVNKQTVNYCDIINNNIVVTNENIDDIMCTALEGGINYWCSRAEVIGDYLGEYASDQISRGGELRLYDSVSDDKYIITRDSLLMAIENYLKEHDSDCLYFEDGKKRIDTCYIDVIGADAIIQYAIFGKIVYS